MNMKTELARLLGLRPKDASAASVAEALAAAEAEATTAAQAVAEHEAKRGRLLLSAPVAEVEDAERDLAVRRDLADRAAAMAKALRSELATAQRAERKAEPERLSREAHEAATQLARWYANEYPKLAAQIIAGFEIEERAAGLNNAVTEARLLVGRADGPEAYNAVCQAAPLALLDERRKLARLPDPAVLGRFLWPPSA